MAEFKIPRIRFTWKNDWAASTAYVKDDIVRYGGKSYVCLVGHTSSPDFNTDLEYINTTPEPDEAAPKWELWFDGFEWKNNWTPNTLYDLGDYVRYNSIIYICTNSHISSANASSGLEVDSDKWTVYAATDNWIKNWTVNYRYRTNDIVRYSGTLYRCTAGHTSAANLTLGLEANSGSWTAITYAYDWKTDWAVSTRYRLGDVVRYGGIVYLCTIDHTSAATITLGIDPDLPKWNVVHSGVEYRFAWTTATRYRLNDVIKYGADLYICTSAHTSTSFNPAYFSVWLPGLEFVNAWDPAISYIKGDIVVYGGYEYICKTTNTVGTLPSTDVANWELLVKNYNIRDEWDVATQYRVGDLVRRHGYLYVAVANSSGVETTDTDHWVLVNPGMHWRGIWVAGNEYVIGDVVTYYASAYICVTKTSSPLTPLADVENISWTLYIKGDQYETLKELGDIQSFSEGAWSSVAIGSEGNLLKVGSVEDSLAYLPVPAWSNWGVVEKVYYVATTGSDTPSYGTTISTPWRTIKYACSQITGPATIFIKTGTYSELLPISVPAGVALVGDELRGTVVQPARTINIIGNSSNSSSNTITVNTTNGLYDNAPVQFVSNVIITSVTATSSTGYKLTLGTTIGMYTGMPIVFSGVSFGNLSPGVTYYVLTYDSLTSTITISASLNGPVYQVSTAGGSMEATAGGFAGLINGQVYYVIGSTITPTTFKIALASGSTIPVTLSDTSNLSVFIYGADAIKDMFYVRNGCGIRNMTLRGLLGGLTSANAYGTKRPTGGAYVSLDPGQGPSDPDVQITTKSPYVQNVTNFGIGCTGLKIDGSLHNAGNRSIVANDFTQIISDGIGVWCTGHSSLTELVSVFTYYSHMGYLAEDGGKIRATNGNTSYGDYGCVAEGYDVTEVPLTSTVNNRNQQAQIAAAFIGEATNKILKLEFSNAGQAYTGATYAFSGAGFGAQAVADEFRDKAVFETRITGTDYTAGGLGYITSGNQAQAGDTQTITIASNDLKTFDNYKGMRVIVTSGTGVGQYGYISYYDAVGKIATVSRESIAAISVASCTSTVLNVTSTANFTPGTPVVFAPNQQVTSTYNTQHTVAIMTGAYILGSNLYITAMGAGAVAPGMTITGSTVLSGTYIISGSGTTWAISKPQTVGSQALPVTLTGTNNLVTLTSSVGMYIGEQIVFTGSTFGNISAGTTYYIINIIGNQVVLSTTYNGSVFAVSNATGLATATAGGMLGGLTAGTVYYVATPNFTSNTFSVGTSSNWQTTTISLTAQAYGTTMDANVVGWENINPGTPSVALLDSTSVYSIEPCVRFSKPTVTSLATVLPTQVAWTSVAYGNGRYVAISINGTTAYSTTGSSWTPGGAIPNGISGQWSNVTFGNGKFIAISVNNGETAYSTNGQTWISSASLGSFGYSRIAFGAGKFIAVGSIPKYASSSNEGVSWSEGSLPDASWGAIAYSSIGIWVLLANGTTPYYSTDGVTWTSAGAVLTSANWSSVTWGNGRFVAVASGSALSAYSFDGVTWIMSSLPSSAAWNSISYGQGTFFAVASGTSIAASSQDGLVWTSRAMPSSTTWIGIAFGNPSSTPSWIAVSNGTGGGSTAAALITGGTPAIGRAVVANNKISSIKIWEPGSGYSTTPLVSITDPNAITVAAPVCRVGNGVLGNPTFVNRGSNYRTSTTRVAVASGDGYADIYQPSKTLVVSGLASLPTPGAALTIAGSATQFRIVLITDLGDNKAQFQVSPPLSIDTAPEHGASVSIRQKYSQCRITGHDFLLVGTGNQIVSNFPNTDVNTAVSYHQIAEHNGGRVFQTSTDQDGNFKVGNLFAVEQASGIVTISADQLSLEGLQTISLGGFSLGTNSVTIKQFSTDSYFTANSDTVVPTQRAIKTYIARNIAGGGANAQAGAVVAGTFGVGGAQRIYSTTQTQLFVRNSMNIKKGINGTMLAKSYFGAGFKSGGF